MMERLLRRLVVVLAVVALVAPAGISAAAPSAPMAGLLDEAEIARDVRGIAHITASNDHDLFFLQGWVHAGDRLFQMDVGRKLAAGTLAELLGPDALPSDVQFRTLGLRRAADRSLPLLSSDAQATLRAYADGVNAWVASHSLPPDYAALGLATFDPWTPLDTATVGKLVAFSQSFGSDVQATLDYAAYVRAGIVGGFDGATLFTEDVFRIASFTDASTVPDAGGSPPFAGNGLRHGSVAAAPPSSDVLRLARDWVRRLERVPSLRAIADASRRGGSNEWAIAGSLSASGLPMIANDPHLDLDMPSTFSPIHLRGDGIDVYGEGFAGAPGVVLGHNRFIAWGATSNPMDVTDVYQERVVPDPASPSGLSTVYLGALEPVVAIPEQYRANVGGDVVPVPSSPSVPPVTLIVPRRNQGPIVALDESSGTALSIQWAGFSGTREIDAILALDRARNIDQFRRGLEWFDVGSQNFSYVDMAGHIAMFTAGEMPLREDLEAGTLHGLPPWFVRDGSGGNEWLPATATSTVQALPYEILPPEEMPHIVDPPAGFFVNANNDPVGTTLDNDALNQLRPTGGIYYLNAMNPGYYGGFRAGRITEMLRERIATGPISFEDMKVMQADVALIDAEVFVPFILRAWDRATTSSTPELSALASDPGIAEAVTRLGAWDHTTPTGIPEGYDAADDSGPLRSPSNEEIARSIGATIYSLWRAGVLANTVDGTVATLGLTPPDGLQALCALRRLLERYPNDHGVGSSGVDFFEVPGVADPDDQRDVLILASLRRALDRLASSEFAPAYGGSTDQDEYRWGKLHRIVFDHPLGGPFSVPPAGGGFPQPLPGLAGISIDGGLETVDASSHDARACSLDGFMFGHGPARRFVAEVAPNIARSRWVSSLPGGTSGRIGDAHYVDLLPAWLTNESYPQFLRRSDLLPTFVSIERFGPA
jgi:penicillin G amidase